MTNAAQRYAEAHKRFEQLVLRPAEDLLTASAEVVAEANKRAAAADEVLELMRPVWAQGYSSDSFAAQGTSTALAQLWKLLGVTNQTAAVVKLKALLGGTS